LSEESLLTAFAALRRGDDPAVLAALAGPWPERPGWRARAQAYRAQALQGMGKIDEAERAAEEAMREAGREGDVPNDLRELHARIAASRTSTVQRARDVSLREASISGAEDADWLVRKAMAHLDRGELDACRHAAGLALAAATEPRDRVLALICSARTGDAPSLLQAHRIADERGDHGLITAVARAAKALGVVLPSPEFDG